MFSLFFSKRHDMLHLLPLQLAAAPFLHCWYFSHQEQQQQMHAFSNVIWNLLLIPRFCFGYCENFKSPCPANQSFIMILFRKSLEEMADVFGYRLSSNRRFYISSIVSEIQKKKKTELEMLEMERIVWWFGNAFKGPRDRQMRYEILVRNRNWKQLEK